MRSDKIQGLLELNILPQLNNIHQTASEIRAQIDKMQEKLEGTKAHLSPNSDQSAYTIVGSRRVKILKWLSGVPYTDHHKRISEGRLDGTAEWLFIKKEYRTWRSLSTSKLLLLRGIRKSPHASLRTSSVLPPI